MERREVDGKAKGDVYFCVYVKLIGSMDMY